MVPRIRVRTELEEQRCLIEQQQVEIRRLKRHLELQAQLTAVIQSELDAIRLTVQPSSPSASASTSVNRSNGNSHRLKWAD